MILAIQERLELRSAEDRKFAGMAVYVSAKAKRPSEDDRKCFISKSGREDSNLRPLGPKPSALPGCATPRNNSRIIHVEPLCSTARIFRFKILGK